MAIGVSWGMVPGFLEKIIDFAPGCNRATGECFKDHAGKIQIAGIMRILLMPIAGSVAGCRIMACYSFTGLSLNFRMLRPLLGAWTVNWNEFGPFFKSMITGFVSPQYPLV